MIERLEIIKKRYEELSLELQNPEIVNDYNNFKKISKEHSDLEETVVKYEEYKKVIAAPYENNSIFANGKTIITSETYFFKVEPIKWRVLEENNGSYKLLSELVLDNKAFSINETNNYEHSNIRAWLNGYDGSNYNVENYSDDILDSMINAISYCGEYLVILKGNQDYLV